MNIKTLKALIDTGRMATVDFVTDKGKFRTLNGRTRVVKYLTGVGAKFNATDKGLLCVWEAPKPQEGTVDGKGRYRYIRAENVTAVRVDGMEIRVR